MLGSDPTIIILQRQSTIKVGSSLLQRWSSQDVLRLPGDVFKKLSSVVRPTDVGRDSAFVNVSGVATRAISVSSSSASHGFRRMNSISAVSPGASLSVRDAKA